MAMEGMQCQVRSMSEANGRAEIGAPRGKVEAVCKQWLVREDGVLAYKLQSEEIEHHYGHNKERNQRVRCDIQEAKVVQQSEEQEAELMQQAYEEMLLEQENADALVAKQIQDRILQEEIEKQRKIEEADKRIAYELQKKEKLKLQKKREEWELKQVEKLKATQSNSSDTSCKSLNGASSVSTQEAATSPLERDFSDLCLQPPSELSQEQQRKFREEQDEELARFLQEQELKRRNQNKDDERVAVEAQDRELAKVLQEQERARAKRAKDRARQKALQQTQMQSQHQQQQQQQQLNMSKTEEVAQVHYAISPIEDIEASPNPVMMKDNDCYGTVGNFKGASNFACHPVGNVAIALDPTYQHRRTSQELPAFPQSPSTSSIISSPQRSPTDSLIHGQRGLSSDFFLQPDEDEDAVAPPYMPIQGQRRLQTLEKAKKNKKHKEGCKTQ